MRKAEEVKFNKIDKIDNQSLNDANIRLIWKNILRLGDDKSRNAIYGWIPVIIFFIIFAQYPWIALLVLFGGLAFWWILFFRKG